MFGYNVRKFLVHWTVILLILAIGAVGALGFNTITKSFSLSGGVDALGALFGGLGNLVGLLVLFIAIIAAFLGARHIAKNDYTKHSNRIGTGSVIVLVAAALVGAKLITIDKNFSHTAWTLVVVIIIVTMATALITPRTKKSTTA